MSTHQQVDQEKKEEKEQGNPKKKSKSKGKPKLSYTLDDSEGDLIQMMSQGNPYPRERGLIQMMTQSSFSQTTDTPTNQTSSEHLPEKIKSGTEALSGINLDDVQVHYNSEKPAEVGAHAYAQGTDIHLATGQEKHLPHEAWHVVQQKQGRVKPTKQLKGKGQVNDDQGLEQEADTMGAQALQKGSQLTPGKELAAPTQLVHYTSETIQKKDDEGSFWDNPISWTVDKGSDLVNSGVEMASDAGSYIADKGEQAWNMGESALNYAGSFLMDQAEALAPGLMKFLRGDIIGIVKGEILGAIDTVLATLLLPIAHLPIGGLINNFLANTLTALQQDEKTSAAANEELAQSAKKIVDSGHSMTDTMIEQVEDIIGRIGGAFQSVWDVLGAPAFNVAKKYLGPVWSWVKEQASWLWEMATPLRNSVGAVWDWVKDQFGIVWGSSKGVLSWLLEKAQTAWEEIKSFFSAILGVVRSVISWATSTEGNSPLGLIKTGAKYIWNAFSYVGSAFWNADIVISAREFLASTIFPAIKSAVNILSGLFRTAFSAVMSLFAKLGQLTHLINDAILGVAAALGGVFPKLSARVTQIIENVTSFTEQLNTNLKAIGDQIYKRILGYWKAIEPVAKFVFGLMSMLGNPGYFAMFLAGFIGKLAWKLLPDAFKESAINFILDLAIGALDSIPNIVSFFAMGPLFPIIKHGALGFLTRIREMGQEDKAKFLESLFDTLTKPEFYGGLTIGIIKGIVWDSVLSLVWMVAQLLWNLPGYIGDFFEWVMGASKPEKMYEDEVQDYEAASADAQVDYTDQELQEMAAQVKVEPGPQMEQEGGYEDFEPLDGPVDAEIEVEEGDLDSSYASELMQEAQVLGAEFEGNMGDGNSSEALTNQASSEEGKKGFMDKLGEALSSGLDWVASIGGKAANSLFSYITSGNPFQIGMDVGSIIGQIIFEVVLAVFTGGAGNAAKLGLKGAQWLSKGIRMLKTAFSKGAAWVMKGFKVLRQVIDKVGDALRLFGGKVAGLVSRIKAWINKAWRWIKSKLDDAFKRRKNKKGPRKKPKKKPKNKKKPRSKKQQKSDEAIERPRAYAEARAFTEMHDKLDTPVPALLTLLKATFKRRYKWIKNFIAEPKATLGVYQIFMIASKVNLGKYKDDKESKKDGWYHGKKPKYENPGHHDKSSPNFRGGGSKTEIIPDNAEELYNRAIPGFTDAKTNQGIPKTWYSIDNNGVIHQFQVNHNGFAHWAGSEKGVRGIVVDNMTRKRLLQYFTDFLKNG